MEPAASTTTRAWPCQPGWPVIGNIPGMVSLGLIPFLEQAWRDLGDCFEFRAGAEVIKCVVHPDDVEGMLLQRRNKYIKGASYDQFRRLVGLGLISSEGELWRRQRRIIQPSFYRDTVHNFGEGMIDLTEAALERWARDYSDGAVFDVHAELMRLTLEIISQTLFQLRLDHDGEITTRSFSDAIGVIAERSTAVLEAPRWMPTPANFRLERAMSSLDRVVMTIINNRRRSGEDRDDMLGALLRARTNEGEAIDDVQLRDEVVTMFLAGHETTAVSLGWTLWLLSQHPEVRAELIASIDAAVGQRRVTMADLPQLGYVKQVLSESMRVISPVWSGARNCVEADTLGPGLPVEPGTRVLHVIWLTHKHPEFWPDPERFDPSRFEPGQVAARHKFAYMPFTIGPRRCVGEHFATIESVLALTQLFQRFDIEAAPGFSPEMDFQLTTRPRAGLHMRLRPRAA